MSVPAASDQAKSFAALGNEERFKLLLPVAEIAVRGYVAARPLSQDHFDDLMSVGRLTLWKCLNRYDAEKTVNIKQWVAITVHHRCNDWLRDHASKHLGRSRRLFSKIRKEREIHERLTHELNREPTMPEILDQMGFKNAADRRRYVYQRAVKHESMDEVGLNGATMQKQLLDDKAARPSDSLERDELKRLVSQGIDELTLPERQAVMLYYFEEVLRQDIAKIMNLSAGRISQILTSAHNKLHRFITSKKVQ